MAKKKKKLKGPSNPAAKAGAKQQNQPSAEIQKKRSLLFTGVAVLAVVSSCLYVFFLPEKDKTDDKPNVQARMALPAFVAEVETGESKFSDFAGSEACRECHADLFAKWEKSTHGRAGGKPGKVKILGQFDNKSRPFKDASFTPLSQKGRLSFSLSSPHLPTLNYDVSAVVGGGHMAGGGTQTYFSHFPDGTVRFLPFDFIRDEKLWFGEADQGLGWLPIDRSLSFKNLSEWPPSRVLGNVPEFENCQECHGSQIHTTFSPVEKKYVTRYKTLAINCESCHGPAKAHIIWARTPARSRQNNIGMKALDTDNKQESVDLCSRCHALKDGLKPGYLPGRPFTDYYSLKLQMFGDNPFHPDGRIRAFGYQQNHLYSDCFLNGSMTCVDCHDPHTQSYRDIEWKSLKGKFDDGQCIDCHPSKGIEISRHTFHKPGSKGSLCTSCHMPFLQHKAMGNELRFARSDHTIPIPRPGVDRAAGIEDACGQCHSEMSTDKLDNIVKTWWGELKPHKPIVSNLMRAKSGELPTDSLFVLLDSDTRFPMAQAAGLIHIIEERLRPDMHHLDERIVQGLKKLSKDDDIDLRALALMALHFARDNDVEIHNYIAQALVENRENGISLRGRWANALAYRAQSYAGAGDFRKALLTYAKALEIFPENIPVLQEMSLAYKAAQDYVQAKVYAEKAILLQPENASSHLNLGLIYAAENQLAQAADSYKKALEINPNNMLANYNLGNHAYRLNRFEEAITFYSKALQLNPGLAEGYFALARSYLRNKQYEDALQTINAFLVFEPENQNGRAMMKDLQKFLKR